MQPEREAEEQRHDARCSRHPDLSAEGTCVRCGDFLCEACVETRVEGQLVCAGCSPHVRATSPLPWDDSPSPGSFVRATGRILLEPQLTFERMAPAPVGRAYWFAVTWWLLPAIPLAVGSLWGMGPRDVPIAAGLAAGALLGTLIRGGIVTGVVAGMVFGTAKLFGGRGRYGTDFRAVAYATPPYAVWEGINAWLPPALVMYMVPLLGVVAVWVGWLLMLAARSHHRLSTAGAAVAGFSPLSLFALIVCAGLVLGLAF